MTQPDAHAFTDPQSGLQPAFRLEARGLNCIRGERTLFSNMTFDIHPGSALHVMGANGSGKTSLLRILVGLSLPDDGMVVWNNQDASVSRFDFYSDLLWLGHSNGLNGNLSAIENLEIVCALGSRNKTPVTTALDQLGLGNIGHTLCRHLSAGQRRRVALARLLLTDARCWILDEPFGSVDNSGIGTMTGMLVDHVTNGGVLLFSSHHDVDLGRVPVTYLHMDDR